MSTCCHMVDVQLCITVRCISTRQHTQTHRTAFNYVKTITTEPTSGSLDVNFKGHVFRTGTDVGRRYGHVTNISVAAVGSGSDLCVPGRQ